MHNEQGYAVPYREVIQRQIPATRRQGYELHDLTDEEIAIVEEATP